MSETQRSVIQSQWLFNVQTKFLPLTFAAIIVYYLLLIGAMFVWFNWIEDTKTKVNYNTFILSFFYKKNKKK